jgi:hypothetical protein
VFQISFVGPVAERFIGRAATTAKRNDRSSLQTVHTTLRVNDLEVAFNFDRAVTVDKDFGRGHEWLRFPQGKEYPLPLVYFGWWAQ